MAAYVIADIDVTDATEYEAYKKGATESIAAFGGRYLARGGKTEVLEGSWNPKRLVILEFPTAARLREWYDSPQYRSARDIRQRTAVSSLVVVEGL